MSDNRQMDIQKQVRGVEKRYFAKEGYIFCLADE